MILKLMVGHSGLEPETSVLSGLMPLVNIFITPFGGLGWTRTNDPYLIRIVL